MVDLKRTELRLRAERAILIQLVEHGHTSSRSDSLAELKSLARTAGAVPVGEIRQQRRRPDPTCYLGRGKLAELHRLCRETDADVVICDDDLRPAQVKTLETKLDLKVVDRSELILDIFASHARTRQAKLQVELAQLEYAFPRLRSMWPHLDRLAGGTVGGLVGGGIGVRGPGEKQLEVDRRLVQRRIHEMKSELDGLKKRRRALVQKRNETFTTVALVGYTNAGKSSVMNALTNAGVSVADRLFETLDTRTRQWLLPDGRSVLLSDTVGFIRKIPHHLIASFHATLEEAREADLLLHIIDVSSGRAEHELSAVGEVLDQIGCAGTPTLHLLNKADLLEEASEIPLLNKKLPGLVLTSATSGQGLEEVTKRVAESLDQKQEELTVEAHVGNGRLMAFLHRNARVLSHRYDGGTVEYRVRMPHELTGTVRNMGGRVRSSQGPAGDDGAARPVG